MNTVVNLLDISTSQPQRESNPRRRIEMVGVTRSGGEQKYWLVTNWKV